MSCRLGFDVSPYWSASVTSPSWKRAIQTLRAAAASCAARAAPRPRARAACETTSAACEAWASADLVCLTQLFVDHFGGLVDERAGTEHDLDRVGRGELAAGPRAPPSAASAAPGTFPDRHPSSPSSRSMSELSTSFCRFPLTSTSIGSSPKSR